MPKILIADDHAVVRSGYRQFLEEEPSIIEIGEAANGAETLLSLRRHVWDLLVMDIRMPDRSGLDILKYVKGAYPSLRVLIVSGLPEEQYARNALRAGANGYLSKNCTPQELIAAVRLILEGRHYVSDATADLMAKDLYKPTDQGGPLHHLLSAREFQIFSKLAQGATVTAIANELSLSVKTISTYRGRVLEKLGLNTNADITAYAMRNEIIP